MAFTSVTHGPLSPYAAGENWSEDEVKTEALLPLEDIAFGSGVVLGDSDKYSCRLPNLNHYVGTASEAIVSGGTVTLTGKIISMDGTETAIDLSQAYSTSNAVTAGLIKDYLEGLDDDVTVTLSGSNLIYTVDVVGDKRLEITAGFARSGSGTATFTNVKGSNDTIRGVAPRGVEAASELTLNTYTAPTNKAGMHMIGVIRRGDPAVPVVGTVAKGGAAYCLFEAYGGGARGSFRPDNTGSVALLVADAEWAGTKSNDLAPLGLLKI